jgi:protein gp37
MVLNKSNGQMFKFCTHTVSPIAGACSHNCAYCFVNALKAKPGVRAKYTGMPRLHQRALGNYRSGNVIFVEDMGDMFANDVPDEVINGVLDHIEKYPNNRYLYLTKNPLRYLGFRDRLSKPNYILGTTLESDIYRPAVSAAPGPPSRATGMALVNQTFPNLTFVSIEPIMTFTRSLIEMIAMIGPTFMAIGADSGGYALPEPTAAEVVALIRDLGKLPARITNDMTFEPAYRAEISGHPTIYLKSNLARILGKEEYNREVELLDYDS